jgi:hypothetical protein
MSDAGSDFKKNYGLLKEEHILERILHDDFI